MTEASRTNLAGMILPEIERALAPLGLEPFRARQIFKWIYKFNCFDFSRMTDISRPTRARLEEACVIAFPVVSADLSDETGTRKIALRLEDGHTVEAVYIPDRDHDTICLSTQVGCALRCSFCLSGARGVKRDLAPHEILSQFLALRPGGDAVRPINVVLMGMGEPCLNLDNAFKALLILKEELGASLSMRRTTLSTAGIIPGIERLGGLRMRPRLAVSLNAARDDLRSELMPINRKYPLSDLLQALRAFPLRKGERITFEYVLIAGVNDSVAEAERTAKLLRGLPCKVNLIPMNPVEGMPFLPPPDDEVDAFARALRRHGYTVVRRRSRGGAISAACGQLAMAGQTGPA